MKDLKQVFFLLILFAFAQAAVAQEDVTGVVRDVTGETLIGATVTEKGTSNGTATDIDGTYSLSVNEGAILVISFTGLKNKELKIDGSSSYDVSMDPDANVLEEVFVTPTSKPIRKIEAVTAVESISAKEIERMNPTSLVDLVRFTPGICVQTQAGRVRNFIFTRGFPDATINGLVYTAHLIDGVRTFASPEMVSDASFRNNTAAGWKMNRRDEMIGRY